MSSARSDVQVSRSRAVNEHSPTPGASDLDEIILYDPASFSQNASETLSSDAVPHEAAPPELAVHQRSGAWVTQQTSSQFPIDGLSALPVCLVT